LKIVDRYPVQHQTAVSAECARASAHSLPEMIVLFQALIACTKADSGCDDTDRISAHGQPPDAPTCTASDLWSKRPHARDIHHHSVEECESHANVIRKPARGVLKIKVDDEGNPRALQTPTVRKK
jgi:hypothetical protein